MDTVRIDPETAVSVAAVLLSAPLGQGVSFSIRGEQGTMALSPGAFDVLRDAGLPHLVDSGEDR